ncbi:MAG: dephospho-CoA kinase [Candidatus Hydrogenedentota bacterium]|nr:MAG: dephospho-CoA kinase [Candidatus Hydrogenedentota bacterium]
MSRAFVIGITGTLGAGKSTLAALLREEWERRRVPVLLLDADAVVHGLFRREAERLARGEPSPLLDPLAEAFGRDVLDEEKGVRRELLAERAFGDRKSRERLNAIVHPHVEAEFRKRIAEAEGVVLLDVPLLFESGMDRLCDVTISVDAPQQERRKRAAHLRVFEGREEGQWSGAEKARRADYAVENRGSPEELRAEARKLVEEIGPSFSALR